MKKIIVIGGGASGLMAASAAAMQTCEVFLFEKMDRIGRKLFITGKGRCNLTNMADVDTILENTPGNPYFLYSSLYTFGSDSVVNYFNALGLPTKVERGGRVFPVSEKSSDVVKALERGLKRQGVKVFLNSPVDKICCQNGVVRGIRLKHEDKFYEAESVIVATGGLSYPATGSTGDGYRFAREAGHSVTALFPSLVGLTVKENWVTQLQGLTLKNVAVTAFVSRKQVYRGFGEMLFTHTGISGPLILSASRFVTRELDKPCQGKLCQIEIDCKPALTELELDTRVLRDFEENINRDFKNALDNLLPKSMIPVIIELSEIPENKKVNNISRNERKKLVFTMKHLTVTISGTEGFNQAVITTGGIEVNEINPSTMESKKIKGLFFAGEVLDIDAFTGGFNLQLAFSTGYMAGINA